MALAFAPKVFLMVFTASELVFSYSLNAAGSLDAEEIFDSQTQIMFYIITEAV